MNTMYDFLDRIQVQKEPGPEQYLGEDGLIYCGKCHTPVQCRITFEGKERIMPCICKCQKEERERQEQRMKEEEQLLYVRRLKATGIQERHLQDWTFASATDSEQVTALGYCMRYAQKHILDGRKDLRQAVEELEKAIDKGTLSALCESSSSISSMAMPRKQEIFACFNRYRGLKLN